MANKISSKLALYPYPFILLALISDCEIENQMQIAFKQVSG